MPLAEKYRPASFDDMVGQEHLVGQNGILRTMADGHSLQSVIFYGPPGTGKTTAALILAESAGKPLHKLNGVSASITDVKKIAADAPDTGCVLYLDEIQYFNKKQQQSLLPYVESGVITLIASTTENPYHDVYDAILSRCLVLEFRRIKPQGLKTRLQAIAQTEPMLKGVNDEVLDLVSEISAGDMRRALNTLELVANQYPGQLPSLTVDDVRRLLPTVQMAGFDAHGDNHYQYISAFQKSIRGSDPDAAVFWLCKLLEGGDIISPSRRLLVIASEDVGLACPSAVEHTLACVITAERLGLPEAYKPLTQATVFLASAAKSNSIEPAYGAAVEDIRAGRGATVPWHLQSECHPGYVYPHDFPDHWTKQQYLPDDLQDRVYYRPGDNPSEQSAAQYWDHVRRTHGGKPKYE